jgi:RNA polymerase sigma factor (sigma-70 family)
VSPTAALPAPALTPAIADSFEDLYRCSRDDVFAYVAALLRDPIAAEDVTALSFERAYRRRRGWDARRGTPRAWIFGIARNAALDELRRRKHGPELSEEPPGEVGPADDLVAGRVDVRAALAALPPRERDVVALKFFADLGHAEIARVLDISESNAGTLLHRALTKLRKACHA